MSEGAGLPSVSDAYQPLAHSKHLKISIFLKRFNFLIVCMYVFWVWVSACKYGAPGGSKTASDPLQLELL